MKFQLKNAVKKVTVGSADDPQIVKEAIDGCDIIFSALSEKKMWKPFQILSDSAKVLIEAMKEKNIERWVGIGHGTILEHEDGGLIGDHGLPSVLEQIFLDKKREYEVWLVSDLQWTLVCPKYMPDGPLTKEYRSLEDRLPEDADRITVEDTGYAMVEFAENHKYIKKRVGIGY
jgi:putative NADH-flavin reductase